MSRRKWLVPEVVQTSGMDCGPAALTALLEGFGVRANYGRLREACQTGVDGTSIDTLEEAAVALGLDAEQVVVPADFALENPRNLPALVVVRLPGGGLHFVIAWRRVGPWVQLMDPASGRRWTTAARLQRDLYLHGQAVDAGDWREFAGSGDFLDPLRGRLRALGVAAGPRVEAALVDESHVGLARLDAAARMVAALVRSGAIDKGGNAARTLDTLLAEPGSIPAAYWSARDGEDGEVVIRGAVLLRVKGRKAAAPELPAELASVLTAPKDRPSATLLSLAAHEGPHLLLVPVISLLVAATTVVAEAMLVRGLFDAGRNLMLSGQRLGAILSVLAFVAAGVMLDFANAQWLLRLGRKMEARLRIRFLSKIPLLGDRYFQSRLVSDMAERAHATHQLRTLAPLAGHALKSTAEVLFTAAGIAWLYPESAVIAFLASFVLLAIPFLSQAALAETDLKQRTHTAALSRFYLDALLGLTPIRAHAAEGPMRTEYNTLLGEWADSALSHQRRAVTVIGLQWLIGALFSTGLVTSRLLSIQPEAISREAGGLLLLTYWTLNLTSISVKTSAALWQYPSLRNIALRLLEPLGAPEEPMPAGEGARGAEGGAAVELDDVSVVAAGHSILNGVSVRLEAGEHVAIVGASGAGKSSLVGLLLGWHRPVSGAIRVDGRALDAAGLAALRQSTAWVDPQVQLWNRPFLENLLYGSGAEPGASMAEVLDDAQLRPVLERLPEGMQTALGEAGALVSGGEGQRIRTGRAFLRPGVRLVILDEPARGLDRESRQRLLAAARRRWLGATVLCITHDVIDTAVFPRVLVIDQGRLVEDGTPAELAAREGARYGALLEAERELREGLWSGEFWRRVRMSEGKAVEAGERA